MRCTSPLELQKGENVDLPVTVRCGVCVGCRVVRSQEWAIRSVHEAQMHERSSFLTLTYSDDDLPRDLSVDVRHWQSFAKRVRKKCGSFRFLHCGEYGGKYNRPHYHALVFGLDWMQDALEVDKNEHGQPLFSSPSLDALWQKGITIQGEVTMQSARYVAGYIRKKITGKRSLEHYNHVDSDTGEVFHVKPEYSTMSRNPGLGTSWFKKYWPDVYPADRVVINGKTYRPPGFYDRLLERDVPEVWYKVRDARVRAGLAIEDFHIAPKAIERLREKAGQNHRSLAG